MSRAACMMLYATRRLHPSSTLARGANTALPRHSVKREGGTTVYSEEVAEGWEDGSIAT